MSVATLPSFIEMYRQLIAAPSVSCLEPTWDISNRQVIDLLGLWLSSLGFTVEIQELEKQAGKYNLLASIGPAPTNGEASGLLLAGHTDTVPWDEGRWTRDPFTLTEADNRLYGLGSADMKGFFAFVIEAIRDLDLSQLKKPLRILATADEETSMAGARELHRFANLKPEFAVIGEPTNMVPVRMHKGHTTDCVRITGRSGHSSKPAAGLNAISIMHEALGELKKLEQSFKDKFHHAAFEVPYPTLNFGHIHGGDAANRICACCELHMDMRPLPGMRIDTLNEMLSTQLAPLQALYPGALEIIPMHDPIPGYECPADSALVKMAEAISGNPAEPANYCTEAPFVDALGCETIVMGPGSIQQAHQPDEFITLAEISPAQAQIRTLVHKVCF
ncbi:acetylornithine deacetylase [Aliidiomarina iranensis]|uniref:Acetylornithine deacetylase n=1 Tax=Aliidiomarina iranensis TaxID=1434071 RepID=A0A432W0T2_9GAMM|nr:acetylornithine deacetylase [Aliidiomarina iranensis]RUO22625.1 acetylornithine deacetylase [Aliidiomarina iranensis]